MKNMYICNKTFKSKFCSDGIPMGATVAFSPVGRGALNEITDAGYPKVNYVAVTTLLTEEGVVFGDFRKFVIDKLLEPHENKKDYHVIFSYRGLDDVEYGEGTGYFSNVKFPESADCGLYWNAVCELKPVLTKTESEEPVDPSSFQYLKNIADVMENGRNSNPIEVIDLHKARLHKDKGIQADIPTNITCEELIQKYGLPTGETNSDLDVKALSDEANKKNENRKNTCSQIAKDQLGPIFKNYLINPTTDKAAVEITTMLASWIEVAAQHFDNEQFYRDLLIKTGEVFGEAAKTSNDGTIQDDVLVLKVPELVKELKEKNDQFKARLLNFIKVHS